MRVLREWVASGPARRVFGLWSVTCVFLFFPFFLLSQIDSIILVLPFHAIAANTAGLLILLTAMAAVAAGVSWLTTLPFPSWRIKIYHVNCVVAVTFSIYELLRLSNLWLKSVFGVKLFIPHTIKMLLFFGCLGLLLAFSSKRKFLYEKINLIIDRLFGASMAVVAASFAVMIYWIPAYHPDPSRMGVDGFPEKPVASRDARTAASSPNRPNVILVTFDALSAEDMSLYGYKLNTTPNIDSLLQDSYVFDHMYANSNWTRPAAASLMTGLYPSNHKLTSVFSGDIFLEDESRTLPRILRDAGFSNSTINNNFLYAHPYGSGSFASFDYAPWKTFKFGALAMQEPWLYPHYFGNRLISVGLQFHLWASDMTRLLLNWWPHPLRAEMETCFPVDYTFDSAKKMLESVDGPKFIWIHVNPPHDPFLPPEPFKFSFLKEKEFLTAGGQQPLLGKFYTPEKQAKIDKLRLRYDEFIKYADHEFGRFIQYLRESGYWDNSILIVSSDHGESFEHNFASHQGPLLYQELIHIPLIVHLPGGNEGKRVEGNAEQVDLAPTILDLLSIPTPGWMDGESLVPAITGQYTTSKPKFSMQLVGSSKAGPLKTGTVAVIKGYHKLIYYLGTEKVELYDLTKDPDELRDLSGTDTAKVAELKELIVQHIIERY